MSANDRLLMDHSPEPHESQLHAKKTGLTFVLVACVGSIALLGLLTVGFGTAVFSSSGPCQTSSAYQRYDSATQAVNFTQGIMPLDLSAESDKVWDALTPPNGGFTLVMGPDGRHHLHGISMYHQLHCLRMLREMAQTYEDQRQKQEHSKNLTALPEVPKHVLHCLDYLAQGIMCSADGTLEPTLGNTRVVNGYNTVHECQDREPLWQLAAPIKNNP